MDAFMSARTYAISNAVFQAYGHTRYQTKPDVEILDFDNRLRASARLVICGDRQYELGRAASTIVQALQGTGMSLDELFEYLQDRHAITRGRLELVVEQLWLLGIIKNLDNSTPAPSVAPRKPPGLALPVLRADWLKPLTGFVARHVSPRVVWPLVGVGIVLHIFIFSHYSKMVIPILRIPVNRAVLAALILVSVISHELAHAAACTNRGVRHGPIGFMIYTIFPAMYTDVSDAWRLPARDRLVVDGAGILTSFLLASLGAALFLISPSAPSAILFLLNDSLVLVNLNPFLRMDGYWLISDLLRVPNLMNCNRAVTAWGLNRLLGRKREVPAILRTKGVLIVYLVYYFLWCAFLCWFGLAIFRFFKAFWGRAVEVGVVNGFLGLTLSAKMQILVLLIVAARIAYSIFKAIRAFFPALSKSKPEGLRRGAQA
jgi:hypothetical protein